MKLHSFLTTLAYDTHSIPYVTLKKKELGMKTERIIKIKSDVSDTKMPVPQTWRSRVLIIPQKNQLMETVWLAPMEQVTWNEWTP